MKICTSRGSILNQWDSFEVKNKWINKTFCDLSKTSGKHGVNRKIRENVWWKICHLPLMKICTSRGRYGWRSGSILIGIALLNASISYMHWHVSNYLHSSRRILFRCVDLGAQFSFQPFLQIILGMKLKVQFVFVEMKNSKIMNFWGVRYLMCNIAIFFSFYVTLKKD